MTLLRFVIVSAIAALSACGPSDDNGNPVVINADPNNTNPNGSPNGNPNLAPNGAPSNGSPGNNRTPMNDREQAIVDGFNAPSDVRDVADSALNLTVEAVVAASIATGGDEIVATGTLTQSGEQFSYAASPADRLVIAWADGPPTDLYVSQFDGDFTVESIDAFFVADHAVEVRLVRDGYADLEVGSFKNGVTREGAIRGSVVDEGVNYEINLTRIGTEGSDADFGSASRVSQWEMAGTISSPNFQLVAEETYNYKHIFVDNSIENSTRTANSTWTYDGKQYAVNDLFMRSAFRNSYPSEADFWQASGTITEDDIVVGQVTFEEDQFHIKFLLLLESGEKIILEEHLKFQE